MRIAVLLLGDRARAESVVRDALLAAWSDLPTLHSERAFRPWLFARVVDTALGIEPAGGEPRALDGLPPEQRALAVLRFGLGLGQTELALTRPGRSAAATIRDARAAEKALQATIGPPDDVRRALTEEATGAELPATFFAQAIAPRLEEPALFELKRSLRTNAVDLAGITVDDVPPSIGGRFGRHDETLVTRTPSTLAWIERVRLPLMQAIEFRWVLAATPGDLLVQRLRGAALPLGPTERVLRGLVDRHRDAIREAARFRLEHVASAIEARAQRR